MTCIRSAFTNDVPLDDAAGWRGSRALGGGGILDRAVHEIDLWRYLLADEVAEVSAVSVPGRTDDDVAVVTARMRRGALATIVVLDAAVVSHELTIYGSHARRGSTCAGSTGSRSRRSALSPARPARASGVRGNCSPMHAGARRQSGAAATTCSRTRTSGGASRRSSAGTCPPSRRVADGRTALEVALAAIESADTRAPVQLAALVT